MRTLHYGIRLTLVLIVVSLFYLGITTLFHQAIQLPVVLTLLFMTFCTERLWWLLAWLSPIIGTVDTKEQEHLVEYELMRSQRYNSPLVIAAIREKAHTSLHIVAQNLRTTDIVLRSSAGYLLVLMPGITLEQSSIALKRITTILPIKDIVVADEKMLKIIIKTQIAGKGVNIPPTETRKICIQAIDAKYAGIKATGQQSNDANIYNLLEPAVSEKSAR